jgi:D-alanine--poly(phosphoribitol) ligase subunit 1
MRMDPISDLLYRCAHKPNHRAVIDGEKVTTYGEFGQLVRRFAADFSLGLGAPKVLINLRPSADAYAAMYGALMAGGYYAPLNVQHPIDLRYRVAELFQPDVVVTTGDPSEGVLKRFGRSLMPSHLSTRTLDGPKPANEIAYVMFTSGSTGLAKGVVVPRSALSQFIGSVRQRMKPTSDDLWSQFANIAFDFSVLDIYGALTSGATLCVLTAPSDRLMPALAIRRLGITIWSSVPSVIDLMRSSQCLDSHHMASLRLMIFCGEPLLRHHLAVLFGARSDLQVWNTYGPTEATVFCSILPLKASNYMNYCRSSVALGEPMPTMGLHVWEEQEHRGELVLTGAQLALGYLADTEGTNCAFRTVEICGHRQRAYFTGDLVETHESQLFFLRRVDRQIKLHGNRVELGQIDSALRDQGFSAVYTVLVGASLVSFIECSDAIDTNAVRDMLSKVLPVYMIPQVIVPIDALPRNFNDKIDVRTLATKAEEIVSR